MFEMGIDLFAFSLICLPINEAFPPSLWIFRAQVLQLSNLWLMWEKGGCLKIMRFAAINMKKTELDWLKTKICKNLKTLLNEEQSFLNCHKEKSHSIPLHGIFNLMKSQPIVDYQNSYVAPCIGPVNQTKIWKSNINMANCKWSYSWQQLVVGSQHVEAGKCIFHKADSDRLRTVRSVLAMWGVVNGEWAASLSAGRTYLQPAIDGGRQQVALTMAKSEQCQLKLRLR